MEIAGLVIGSIALTNLFGECMSLFNTLEAGRNCGTEYSEAALEVTLLGQRLARWASAYNRVRPHSTREEGESAKAALEEILRSLQAAQARGARYGSGGGASAQSQAVVRITEAEQKKTLAFAPPASKLSWLKRGRWALHDKEKFQDSIAHMASVVTSLEAISNNILAGQLWTARDEAALDIVQPPSVEEPDEALPDNAKDTLRAAAAQVDPEFSRAIANHSHTMRRFKVDATANLFAGDWTEKGQKPQGYGHLYEDFTITGNAKVWTGNKTGGSDPMDFWK